jgi:hypothetical protein
MFGLFSANKLTHDEAIELVVEGIKKDGYEGGMKVAIKNQECG